MFGRGGAWGEPRSRASGRSIAHLRIGTRRMTVTWMQAGTSLSASQNKVYYGPSMDKDYDRIELLLEHGVCEQDLYCCIAAARISIITVS